MKKNKALIYVTKKPLYLLKNNDTYTVLSKNAETLNKNNDNIHYEDLNGKIVAEFEFDVDKIYAIKREYHETRYSTNPYITTKTVIKPILEKSNLFLEELDQYLNGEDGYAINIENLHIFDKPKELSECYKKYESKKYQDYSPTYYMPIAKAPQNMMRVWLYENGEWVMYILISIQPHWAYRILSGSKTKEIRKKISKGMLE